MGDHHIDRPPTMIKAIWISGGLALIALIAMFMAPAGMADPLGTAFRMIAVTVILAFLGRLVGSATHRRPPNPAAVRVVLVIVATVAILVPAIWFSPGWSTALALWHIALFMTGVLLNRWCDAPERYAVLVAAFSVFLSSLILVALSAASPLVSPELSAGQASLSLWRNVARIAGQPGDAAWVWLAWHVADRLRAPEAKRAKAPGTVPAKRVPPRQAAQ